MKIKSALLIALLFIFANLHAQENPASDSFAIGIKIPAKSVVKNLQLNGDDRYIEVMKLTGKKRTFRGTVSGYGLFTLLVDYYDSTQKKMNSTSIPLFMVPGYTEIVFGASSPVIQINGVSAKPRFEYALMIQDDEEFMARIQESERKLEKAKKTGTADQISQARKKLADAEESRRENLYAKFVRNNPKSPVALYAMNMYAMMSDNPLETEALLNSMSTDQMNSPQMVKLRKYVDKQKLIMVGVVAPEFTQADTSGNPLALKDLRGNYVLLDFWASWCHPCREQNPAMVKLYEKYKSKGFTILGISLDSKKESWVQAINHDKLTWHHVSDLHFWSNEVAKQYAIQSVPQNFLLDTNGKIIAKNLSEEELEATLNEAYKNASLN